MLERLISASEVARRGGWHNVTIYQWAKTGKIPGVVRFGRQLRFRESEIDRWFRGSGSTQEHSNGR
jgi:excisionase family DNA binding protein